jgi:probable rRNA maturation factor
MSLTLEWNNEQSEIDPAGWISRLQQLLDIAGEQEGVETGEVALTFVDDEAIRELNRDYRGKDSPTDVLSFAMQETMDEELGILYEIDDTEEADEGDETASIPDLLGDIVISVPRAKEQSEEYGHSLEREIGFLFVHGFLHLVGYDHQDESAEKEMFDKQERILQKAGLTR